METDRNHFIQKKHIRVFISSTFKDLFLERNVLMRRTFPKLREEAQKYGIALSEVDLRWGITDDESKLGNVLQICLEEVDNAIPFFIGIVGKRYGWIPQKSDINEHIIEEYPSVENYLKEELSITEMEMRYGVLSRDEDINALFFIPEEEDDEICLYEKEKLHKLKNMLLNNGKHPVFKYSCPQDISNKVEEYFIDFIETEWGASLQESPHEEELDLQYAYANMQTGNYIGSPEFSTFLDQWMESTSSIVVIQGDNGVGKSTHIANWLLSDVLRKNRNIITIPQFVGRGNNRCSGDYIKDIILKNLAQYVNEESLSAESNVDERIVKALKDLPSQYTFLLIIDGINQITENERTSFLNWIRGDLNPNVKILISTSKEDKLANKLIAYGADVLNMNSMCQDDKKRFIENYLSAKAKKMNAGSLEQILHTSLFSNISALKILLDTTILFSSYESVEEDIKRYADSSSLSDFYSKILLKLNSEFGQDFVQKIFSLIYVSKNGLYEDEIIQLCEITSLEWAQFYRLIKSSFSNERGKIRITNFDFLAAIEKSYLRNNIVLINSYKKLLIDFFNTQQTTRPFCELPFLYEDLNMLDELYDYIINPEVASYFLRYEELAFARLWKRLSTYKSSYQVLDYLKQENIEHGFYLLLGIFCMNVLNNADIAQKILDFQLQRSIFLNEKFSQDTNEICNQNDGLEIMALPDNLRYTGSLCSLGDIKYEEGLFDEALNYYIKASDMPIEKEDYFNYSQLEFATNHIPLFCHDEESYYRLAYVFNKLGIVYDDLGYQDTACLMFNTAENYALRINEHKNLLIDIYHNWGTIIAAIDPHKSIHLLGKSIELAKEEIGIDHDSIPLSLSAMGVTYNDYLHSPKDAVMCYNKAIEIETTLEKEDIVLGNLYYNKGIALENFDDKLDFFNKAILIFQKLFRIDKLIMTYRAMADAYYNLKDYVNSLQYYLVCHEFSWYFMGENEEQTVFFANEVIESYQMLECTGKKIPMPMMESWHIFLKRAGKLEKELLDEDQVVNIKVCSLSHLMTNNRNWMHEDIEVFRATYFTVKEVILFYNRLKRLPQIDEVSVLALIYVLYVYDSFHPMVIEFVDGIQDKSLFAKYDINNVLKWETLCFYLHIKNHEVHLSPEDLMFSISSAERLRIRESVVYEKRDVNGLLLKTLYSLNDFIYQVYIPENKLDYAQKTIKYMLDICPDNIDFIDTKAEILYRIGDNAGAIKLVKNIVSIAPDYYPQGNEFLYNSIFEML